MSPWPRRLRHGMAAVEPGMTNSTAPGVHELGQATFVPLELTQWDSFARSPEGGVPAAGSVLGRLEARGGRSGSGGAAPPTAQALVMVPLPSTLQKVSPEHVLFLAR